MLSRKNILGIDITDSSEEKVLEYIITSLKNNSAPYYIVTPNPEMIVAAQSSSRFKEVLNSAGIALADGVGLFYASRILGAQLQARIAGTDLLEKLCKHIARENKSDVKKPITVGFLGGRGNVAERTAKCLMARYPGLEVVFAKSEWPEEESDISTRGPVANFLPVNARSSLTSSNDLRVVGDPSTGTTPGNKIHDTKTIDVLFVAYGFPKQEYFMAEHLGKIPVKVMMGVGGAFDYISGEVMRAPIFVRKLGLEWLFRLVRQPWRIKRQLALLKFIWLVVKEKFSNSSK